jgi:hypothetical protein
VLQPSGWVCWLHAFSFPASQSQNLIMKSKILLPLLTAILLATGCEPCPHYNRLQIAAFYGATPQTKKSYGTVTPFQTPADVGRPYEAIGFMSCEGSAGEEGAILKAMLYRAADMGADGIILNPPSIGQETVSGGNQNINVKFGWMALIGNGDQRAFRAQAIKFKNSNTSTNAP